MGKPFATTRYSPVPMVMDKCFSLSEYSTSWTPYEVTYEVNGMVRFERTCRGILTKP